MADGFVWLRREDPRIVPYLTALNHALYLSTEIGHFKYQRHAWEIARSQGRMLLSLCCARPRTKPTRTLSNQCKYSTKHESHGACWTEAMAEVVRELRPRLLAMRARGGRRPGDKVPAQPGGC